MTSAVQNTKPEGCLIVEGVVSVHERLRQIAQTLPNKREEVIGTFSIGRKSASWEARCSTCIGSVSVRHFFDKVDLGQVVSVSLPDSCPLKPEQKDAPIIFHETSPH